MTDADTEAIKRRVEAWSNSKQGYRERGESNHAPWHYDISAMRTAGNALVGAVETLLAALDAAERENSRLREALERIAGMRPEDCGVTWVKHFPRMDVARFAWVTLKESNE